MAQRRRSHLRRWRVFGRRRESQRGRSRSTERTMGKLAADLSTTKRPGRAEAGTLPQSGTPLRRGGAGEAVAARLGCWRRKQPRTLAVRQSIRSSTMRMAMHARWPPPNRLDRAARQSNSNSMRMALHAGRPPPNRRVRGTRKESRGIRMEMHAGLPPSNRQDRSAARKASNNNRMAVDAGRPLPPSCQAPNLYHPLRSTARGRASNSSRRGTPSESGTMVPMEAS